MRQRFGGRLSTSLLFTSLVVAALLVPRISLAGGWALITLDAEPVNVQPGVPFTVGFMVRQHGVTPMANLDPTVKATNTETKATVSTTAKPEGKTGHYVATLTLPEAGTWNWEINAFHPVAVMAPLEVRAPAPETAPIAQPVAAPEGILPVGWLWGALVVLIAIPATASLLRLRTRRRTLQA